MPPLVWHSCSDTVTGDCVHAFYQPSLYNNFLRSTHIHLPVTPLHHPECCPAGCNFFESKIVKLWQLFSPSLNCRTAGGSGFLEISAVYSSTSSTSVPYVLLSPILVQPCVLLTIFLQSSMTIINTFLFPSLWDIEVICVTPGYQKPQDWGPSVSVWLGREVQHLLVYFLKCQLSAHLFLQKTPAMVTVISGVGQHMMSVIIWWTSKIAQANKTCPWSISHKGHAYGVVIGNEGNHLVIYE